MFNEDLDTSFDGHNHSHSSNTSPNATISAAPVSAPSVSLLNYCSLFNTKTRLPLTRQNHQLREHLTVELQHHST